MALSGDANPIHTDALVARRLPFGRVAVHGMHIAMRALDDVIARGIVPGRLRATFRQPVGVDDDIELAPTPTDAGVTVRITVDGRLVADVCVDAGDAGDAGASDFAGTCTLPSLPDAVAPAVLGIGGLAGRSGSVSLGGDAAAIAARFPHLPLVAAVELLAITRLVGMEVPGLHSMLSSFDVSLAATSVTADPDTPLALAYCVESVDERFSKVVLRVDGQSVHGTVTAFVRPAPTDPIVDTSAVVSGEFAGVRALVVGGSRGLGAAAVQLLATGGAGVRFTYRCGAADAARVAAVSPGATAHRLDVDRLDGLDGLDAIVVDGWQPTLVAWFASPPIFVGARDHRSPALADRFRRVYVDAFLATVERVGADRLDGVLWPSSEAVATDVPGLAEYADAKRAGELACAELAAAHPRLTVHTPRFPRLRTDQTATFVPVAVDEPAPHVLAALRALRGRHRN